MDRIFSCKEMYYGTQDVFSYRSNENGSLQLVNIPEDLSKYYPIDYHCHSLAVSDSTNVRQALSLKRDKAIAHNSYLSPFRYVNVLRPTKSIVTAMGEIKLNRDLPILDVGCGGGRLLSHLDKLGFNNLSGADPFLPESLVKLFPRITFHKSDIFNLNGKYHLIILDHSLEHMHDHEKVFSKIKELVVEKGFVLIRTPLSNCKAWDIYKQFWYQIDAPRHLFIHSYASLCSMIGNNGLLLRHVIFDSDFTQFARSELYKRNISMKEFLTGQGNYLKYFSSAEMKTWKDLTKDVNRQHLGDQALFICQKV